MLPRESGALIASRATEISVDPSGISAAADFLTDRLSSGGLAMDKLFGKVNVHPTTDDSSGAEWVFFTSVLNFSFWNLEGQPQYEVTYKEHKHIGYMSMTAAISRTLDSGVALTSPDFYADITEEKLNGFLMGDQQVPCPLIKERVQCLHGV